VTTSVIVTTSYQLNVHYYQSEQHHLYTISFSQTVLLRTVQISKYVKNYPACQKSWKPYTITLQLH